MDMTTLAFAVAIVATGYVVMRAKTKRRKDPLEKVPTPFSSLHTQRQVESQMTDLLVELDKMARQMNAQLDTRAAKLEELLRQADARVAQLEDQLAEIKSYEGDSLRMPPAGAVGSAMPVEEPALPVRGGGVLRGGALGSGGAGGMNGGGSGGGGSGGFQPGIQLGSGHTQAGMRISEPATQQVTPQYMPPEPMTFEDPDHIDDDDMSIHLVHPTVTPQQQLSPAYQPAMQQSPQQPAPSPGGTPMDPRHAAIYQLADGGLSTQEIARELQRPPGEIELILALRRRDR